MLKRVIKSIPKHINAKQRTIKTLIAIHLGLFSYSLIAESKKAPEYPVIAYAADPMNAKNFTFIRSLGFNTIHTYGMGRNTARGIERDKKYMDLAQQQGLKVLFNLNGKGWVKPGITNQEFRDYIRKFKNHPALFAWYLYDEPRSNHIVRLQEFYKILKEETPNIPVCIAQNWAKEWKFAVRACDILMPDNYPVANQVFPNAPLINFVDFVIASQNLGKPVIPVAQMYNFKALPSIARDRMINNSKPCRYPELPELRYWLFSSIMLNTRGIAFYSYWRSVIQKGQTKGKKWAITVFSPAIKEYNRFREIIANDENGVSLKRMKDTRYAAKIYRSGNNEYLVLINHWPTPQTSKRWMEGIVQNATLEPWGSTSNSGAKIVNGKLNIGRQTAPWEVLVWKMTRTGDK